MDTVLYDGHCEFCRRGIATLRRMDVRGQLEFVSLHDPSVAERFGDLSHQQLMDQMYVVAEDGRRFGGADAMRYLSRHLPLLYPLAIPMHVPCSMPLWRGLYKFVARNRYRIAGRRCEDGTCSLHG